MKQLFKFFLPPFYALFTSAGLWYTINIWLPKTPLFYIAPPQLPTYFDVFLSPLFFQTERTHLQKNENLLSLENLTLKAIYRTKSGGFIIVEDGKKRVFIDLGKSYKGYKLIDITPSAAIFLRNQKKYKIEFPKNLSSFSIPNITYEDTKTISRTTLRKYTKNLTKIWQNISLQKTSKGYRVTYVNPHSVFYNLGLRKGDLLIEVNDIELKNDKEAWNLYKNIDTFDTIEITILRNNERKVLRYALD